MRKFWYIQGESYSRRVQTQLHVEEELHIIEDEDDDDTSAPQAEIVETEAADQPGDPIVGDNPLLPNAQGEVPQQSPEETVRRYP